MPALFQRISTQGRDSRSDQSIMVNDPIADLLTQIRNAYMGRKGAIAVSYSNGKREVAEILVKKHYIASVETRSEKDKSRAYEKKVLHITLSYPDGKPAVEHIARISSPGRRIYVDRDHLPIVRSGIGMAIISTSQGVMSNKQAYKKGIGGEVICYVW